MLKNSSKKSKKQTENSGSEAGEDTDEGDVQSQEMDYFSSSSESDNEEVENVIASCSNNYCNTLINCTNCSHTHPLIKWHKVHRLRKWVFHSCTDQP